MSRALRYRRLALAQHAPNRPRGVFGRIIAAGTTTVGDAIALVETSD
ncbi:MAG: hypothetical protein MJE77_25540 [Proteobacteria bacterium]|nr:hypothetical protein [Pseudomonadota bacterium]